MLRIKQFPVEITQETAIHLTVRGGSLVEPLIFHVRKARDVIFFAFEEAHLLNENWVGEEHLLLGLIHRQDQPTFHVLRQLGIEPDDIRSEVKRQGDRSMRINFDIRLTNSALRALDAAIEEAKQLGHQEVADEHVFLGILHETNSLGAAILMKMGAILESARNIVRQEYSS